MPKCRQEHPGHTLVELMVAMIASAMLLVGLGSVMLIARQVAFVPMAPTQRLDAADAINELASDLRFATLLIEQKPNILDFVVADRDADGRAERIRYEWTGMAGDPLTRTYNGNATKVLDSVQAFQITPMIVSETTTLSTSATTAETLLTSNTSAQSGADRDITSIEFSAQQINPLAFVSPAPANATAWNLTRAEFIARQEGSASGTLVVQLRPAGDPDDSPTSYVSGQVDIPEGSLTSGFGWNTATFASPVTGLALHRPYTLVFAGVGGGDAARLRINDTVPNGVLESNDGGDTWQYMTDRQMYYRIYGTYTTPGPQHDVTRKRVPHVRIELRTGAQDLSRVDASIPLVNSPELLSAYWRTDFDGDPTAIDGDGDGVADWAEAGGGSFDVGDLIDDVWYSVDPLETRPDNDFTYVTTVDVRCRNTTIGGNGAVVRINADRQGGLYAPLYFHVQLQSDGTQSVTLYGKPSDAANVQLFRRGNLSSGFVRVRMTIVPEYDIVGLEINGEDQGAFAYPIYAPSSNDRFLTLYPDTSLAEFDYIEVRVAAE